MPSLYRCLVGRRGLGPACAVDEPQGAPAPSRARSSSLSTDRAPCGAPIEGARQTKLVLAREALRRGLGKLSPQARVGLAVFGHRRGDCSDVEVVRQPEPLDVGQVMAPLEQFNPRGRGPLTLALREAAKSLPRGRRPAHAAADP